MMPPCEVRSPMRAAGIPLKKTVAAPVVMTAGGPSHVADVPTTAADSPLMRMSGQ